MVSHRSPARTNPLVRTVSEWWIVVFQSIITVGVNYVYKAYCHFPFSSENRKNNIMAKFPGHNTSLLLLDLTEPIITQRNPSNKEGGAPNMNQHALI